MRAYDIDDAYGRLAFEEAPGHGSVGSTSRAVFVKEAPERRSLGAHSELRRCHGHKSLKRRARNPAEKAARAEEQIGSLTRRARIRMREAQGHSRQAADAGGDYDLFK